MNRLLMFFLSLLLLGCGTSCANENNYEEKKDSLVIYPGIDGLASSPSIFEYLGAPGERPADGQSLELISAMPYPHGVVRLRYRFHHDVR